MIKVYKIILLFLKISSKFHLTSGIKEVAKRFGKFQQEISFYPLLNEGERSERLQAVPEDFYEVKTAEF